MKKMFCALVGMWIIFLFTGCTSDIDSSLSTTLEGNAVQQQSAVLSNTGEETTVQEPPSTTLCTTREETTSLKGVRPSTNKTGNRLYNYLVKTNSYSIGAAKIIEAIKAKDVAALEELMCRNIKENVKNLPEEVGKLVNSIDGEIIHSSYRWIGDYKETSRDGHAISQCNMDIYLATQTDVYYLSVVWETANTFAIEETCIRGTGLMLGNQILCVINATEGVGEWHE